MAKMMNAADKEAIAKEKQNQTWTTSNGFEFYSNQSLNEISLNNGKYLFNRSEAFESLAEAIAYANSLNT